MTATGTRSLVTLEVRAVPENVGHVRQLLGAFAGAHGADAPARANIALAVSEAVANAVLHGYHDSPPGSIHVVAEYEDDAIEIVIGDDGHGMAAHVESEGLGLGLGLIARIAGRFTVRDRDPRGTEVWMRFHI